MEISNKNEIHKSDFDTMVTLRGYETYTAGQIAAFIKVTTDNLSKSEGSVKEAEELVKAEFEDLAQWVVVNDKFEKEIMFTRLPIMEKGVYTNNAINRKLGRVGQEFKGEKKTEEGSEKKEKQPAEEDNTEKESTINKLADKYMQAETSKTADKYQKLAMDTLSKDDYRAFTDKVHELEQSKVKQNTKVNHGSDSMVR